MRYVATHPGSFVGGLLLAALAVLLLVGCEFAEEHPRSFVVPLLHWHFPVGLSKPTPHWFPYSLPRE